MKPIDQYRALRSKLVEIAKSGEGQDLVDALDHLWNAFTETMESWANLATEIDQLKKELAAIRQEQQVMMLKADQTTAVLSSMAKATHGAMQGN